MSAAKLWLFDIDGTLVDTGGAGMRSLQEATVECFGDHGPELDLAGSTDLGVVAGIFGYGNAVGVATVDIKKGQRAQGLFMDSQKKITVKALSDIPLGHKIALKDFKDGDTVLKYGHDIGRVVKPIKKGEHVHIHNLKTKRW